jgi:hypothetical protein
VQTNISGVLDSEIYDYEKLLLAQGVDLATASKEDVVNAVENIIVDELALETAFEGNRFTDLVRMAEHKNASGYNGSEWIANKIANRGIKADKNDPSNLIGTRDDALYSKLLDQTNWYFDKPEWEY